MVALRDFRERKLVQWVIAYCAGAWALLEVVDFLTSRFGWPDALVRGLTIVLAFGIPAVLVLAWFHGERGAQRVSALELGLLTALLIGAGAGAYAVRGSAVAPLRQERPADDGSLAIVPFRNLSSDPEQEHFSDGFTDELSTALAGEGLHVVAPSAFGFTGTRENVRELALELSARYLLEGSVARAGTEVRVNARLVTTATSRQVWAARYESQLSPANVLAVQGEIARAIVAALKLRLTSPPRPALGAAATSSQEAYDAYLRGLGALARVTRASYDEAARQFARALELDPAFARAHSGLAFSNVGWYLPLPPDRPRRMAVARRAARRALQLDSALAEPHVVLARLASLEGDTFEERRQLEIALRKEPNALWPRYFMGLRYLESGDRARVLAQADTLLLIDPTSPWNHIAALNLRTLAGDFARADAVADRAEQLIAMGFGPQPTWALYWNRATIALMRGQYERSAELFARGFPDDEAALRDAHVELLHAVSAIRAGSGTAEEQRRELRALVAARGDAPPDVLLTLYLHFGDRDRAYEILEDAVRAGRTISAAYGIYDAIRDEPRFRALVAEASRR